eukprot:4076224-Amphidinium_carterae.8
MDLLHLHVMLGLLLACTPLFLSHSRLPVGGRLFLSLGGPGWTRWGLASTVEVVERACAEVDREQKLAQYTKFEVVDPAIGALLDVAAALSLHLTKCDAPRVRGCRPASATLRILRTLACREESRDPLKLAEELLAWRLEALCCPLPLCLIEMVAHCKTAGGLVLPYDAYHASPALFCSR